MSLHRLLPYEHTAESDRFRATFSFTVTPEGIRLSYRIEATRPEDLRAVLGPLSGGASERKDELWKATCLEAFFGHRDSSGYFEFNASPRGDWAWYAFDSYRAGMRSPEVMSPPKRLPQKLAATRFECEWLLPHALFGETKIDTLSATAILDLGGTRTYWAIAHTGAKPDFHLRDSFVVSVEDSN